MKFRKKDINTNKGILSTFSRSRSNTPILKGAVGDYQGAMGAAENSEYVYINNLIASAANNYGKG